jgi:hypothetical protein
MNCLKINTQFIDLFPGSSRRQQVTENCASTVLVFAFVNAFIPSFASVQLCVVLTIVCDSLTYLLVLEFDHRQICERHVISEAGCAFETTCYIKIRRCI